MRCRVSDFKCSCHFLIVHAHGDAFSDSACVVMLKVKNLSYFPSEQQRWQVQVYGYLIDKSGLGKVQNVNLVAIPRDGDERDVVVHSEPYDETIALEALNWLEAIKTSDSAPAPERDESYCKFYCKYYDASGEMGCVGLKKERTKTELEIIENPEAGNNALHYLQLDEEIKKLEGKKSEIRETLLGITGVTQTGIEIKWSTIQSFVQRGLPLSDILY